MSSDDKDEITIDNLFKDPEEVAASATEESSESASTEEAVVEEAAAESEVVAEGASDENTSDGDTSEEDEAPAEEAASPVADEETPAPVIESSERIPGMEWYVVNAYSSFETKAKEALEERIRSHGLEDRFGQIRVPQETVTELVRGQKKTSNRKFFPGYILVEMKLDEDTWHLVKETPKISGFVGDRTDPVPMSDEEVDRLLSQEEDGALSKAAMHKFEQGETVKVIDGPFADFSGTIEEVKPDKGKIKVLINIFGRATPVDLDFIQVEKC